MPVTDRTSTNPSLRVQPDDPLDGAPTPGMSPLEGVLSYIRENPITTRLALLMIVVHVLQWRLGVLGFGTLEFWMFHVQGWTEPHLLSTLTSTIAHSGFIHLGGNLLFLLLVGPTVEEKLGPPPYLVTFFAAGAVAGGAQVVLTGGSALGASGAVLALIVIWIAYELPTNRLPPILTKLGYTPTLLSWVLLLGIPVAISLGATPLGATFIASNVAHVAHLVGYLFGLVLVAMFSFQGSSPPLA